MPVEPDYVQEEKDLRAGTRVQEFLTDEHVTATIKSKLEDLSTKIWRCKKPEDVLDIWYEGRGMMTAMDSLKVTADKAQKVELDREARDRLASRQTPRGR